MDPSADLRAMFAAHVRFELDRWDDAGLRTTVAEELDAAFSWLDGVRIRDLAEPDQVCAVVLRVLTEVPLAGAVEEILTDGARAVHDALSRHEVRLEGLVTPGDHARLVETVVGMRGVRQEVIEQITASSVYAKLIAHVLYNGIKDYLVTQNSLTRRIPGASSMLRLGQSAVNAAAPSLERAIDRQLTAFIAANVTETVRGSSAFLTGILDDDMIRAVGAEVWATNRGRAVSDVAALVSQPSAIEAMDAGRALWSGLRRAPVVAEVVTAVVAGFFESHGDRSPAAVLTDLGITPGALAGEVSTAVGPLVQAARESGFLQDRVRARLAAFYATYLDDDTLDLEHTFD